MHSLVSCPDCGVPAEVTERFWLPSTDGPVDHIALSCVAGHHFRMAVDALSAQGQEQLAIQVVRAKDKRPGPIQITAGTPTGHTAWLKDARVRAILEVAGPATLACHLSKGVTKRSAHGISAPVARKPEAIEGLEVKPQPEKLEPHVPQV